MTNVVQSIEQGQQVQPTIRWMIRRDLPEVMHIERESFKDPWGEENILLCLDQRNCSGMSVEIDEKSVASGKKVVAFFLYELCADHLRIINLAVHPQYRGQGFGELCMRWLLARIARGGKYRYITALVPESCLEVKSFFEKYGVAVCPTEEKGKMVYKPFLAAMAPQDVDDAQEIENKVLERRHSRKPRRIGDLISRNSCYGIVAREKYTKELMGYVLYERDSNGVAFNGEFGVIVDEKHRKRGVGRKLVEELVKLNLPITVRHVCLTCEEQCGFLRAVGVPIPELQRFVDVQWQPEVPKA